VSNLDLNSLPPDLQATLTKKETDGERRVRLFKDVAVFAFALVILMAAFVWSAWAIISAAADADEKHVAQTVLVAIVSGLVGYLLKR
jgi:zona occludens toxin (predicted ATPase)